MKSSSKPPRPQVEQLEDRCVPSVTITEFPTPTTGTGLGGIAAGPDGNLWFTEGIFNEAGVTDHIGVINPTTHAVTEYALPTPNSGPQDIVAGPDGNLWFTEQRNGTIGQINPATGAVTETTVQSSSGPAPTAQPAGITVGPDGNIWFGDVAADSSLGIMIPSTHAGTEFFIPANDVTAGPDGKLWTTSLPSGGNLITSLDLKTGAVNGYPIPTAGSFAQDITAGPDGNLWFTEEQGNNIGRINPATGVITEYPIPTPNSEPFGITAGPDGNLWFAETIGNNIGEISPSTGAITEYPVPTPNGEPVGITAGPDGNLWFTEANGNQIGEVVFQKTPTVTWNSPADVPVGTALGPAQLDATASVPGTFQYTPAARTVLPVGANQPLSATFTPTDTIHYTSVTVGTTINVVKATPAFAALASPTAVVGTASVTLTGTLSAPTAVPAGATVTITAGGASTTATVQADGTFSATLPTAALAVGSYPIDYEYAGGADFNAASGSGTLQVTNGVAVLFNNNQPVQAGTTLPIEIGLTDAAGANLSSGAVAVHADYQVRVGDPSQAHLPVQAPGNSQPGNFFKHHGSRYHFDLNTTGLAPGTYELFFSAAGDPVEHSVSFTVG